MPDQLQALIDLGPQAIYLKGGHGDDPNKVLDLLWDGKDVHEIRANRIPTANTHGTGCSLAASLASNLALGMDVVTAARRSHDWLHRAIAAADSLHVGSGHGPVWHGTPP